MIDLGIRAQQPEDIPFIFATWLWCVALCSPGKHSAKSRTAYRQHRRVVESILSRSATLVAHLPDDPNIIIGYICVEKLPAPSARPVIHFLYVKGPWRNMGVGKLLLGELDPNVCCCSHMSKGLQEFLPKYPGLIYNPKLAR